MPESLGAVSLLHCKCDLTQISEVQSPFHKYFDVWAWEEMAPFPAPKAERCKQRSPSPDRGRFVFIRERAKNNGEGWNRMHRICWKAGSVEFPAKIKAGKSHLVG